MLNSNLNKGLKLRKFLRSKQLITSKNKTDYGLLNMKYKWLHNYEFNAGILKNLVDKQFFGKVLKLDLRFVVFLNENQLVF